MKKSYWIGLAVLVVIVAYYGYTKGWFYSPTNAAGVAKKCSDGTLPTVTGSCTNGSTPA
jgi:hypothetical protein